MRGLIGGELEGQGIYHFSGCVRAGIMEFLPVSGCLMSW